MPHLDEAILDTLARASTLDERRAPCFAPADVPDDVVDAVVARWRRASTGDDPAGWARRLACSGVDEDGARALARRTALRRGEALPAWMTRAAEALGDAADTGREVWAPRGGDELPFEHVFHPWVGGAYGRWLARAGRGAEAFEEGARRDLTRALVRRLFEASGEALWLEWQVFLARRGAVEGDPRARYDAFVARCLEDGGAALFAEYPALARVVGGALAAWVDVCAEFVARVAADRARLGEALGGGVDPGAVRAVQMGLSDPHDGGRGVAVVSFASGLRAVYKPRSFAVDEAFARALGWFNAKGFEPRLRAPATLDRGAHGWAAFVDHRPCASEGEVEDFYRRAGGLLAVVHFLEGNDFHHENVVADGPHPVLIDLETLCQHRRRAFVDIDHGADEAVFDSVVRTQLLPRWDRGADGRSFDLSGLGGDGAQSTGFLSTAWDAINTDAMRRVQVPGALDAQRNRPTLDGRPVDPGAYVDALVEGFSRAWRIAQENVGDLLAADGPVERFRGLEVRYLVRATSSYTLLLAGSRDPRNLRDGALWGAHFELLSRAVYARPEHLDALAPLALDELRTLCDGDVPRFTAHTDDTRLRLGDGALLDGHLSSPAMTDVRARVASATDAQLALQVAVIRAAMFTRAGAATAVATPEDGPAEAPQREALVAFARDVGAQLLARGMRTKHGALAWMAVIPMESGRRQLQGLGPGLYAGQAGVALFLAELARVTGEARFDEGARAALAPVRAWVDGPRSRALAAEHGLGVGFGVGSMIYGLLRVADALDDDTMRDDAARLAALVTEDHVRACREVDLLGGVAGLILALARLDRVRPAPHHRALALRCGERVLDARVAGAGGARAWVDAGGHALAGISHGAAGVAAALGELAAWCGDGRFEDAAREALAHERALYLPAARNWPDLREGGSAPGTSWCHGAPGVALARMMLPAGLRDARAEEELAVGAETTAALARAQVDTLCCGNLGRAEVLWTLGFARDREDWRDAATARVGAFLARAARGDLRWATAGGMFDPCLFQGAAGVGLQMLRMAAPERVRPVLSFA